MTKLSINIEENFDSYHDVSAVSVSASITSNQEQARLIARDYKMLATTLENLANFLVSESRNLGEDDQ